MKIYIANFPGTVTCADLTAFFTPYGSVTSSELALDAFTGVSRGFGFVTMPDTEAGAAITALNGTEWHGLQITVSEAPAERQQTGSYPTSAGRVQPYTFRKN